jgi:hypothetical protein
MNSPSQPNPDPADDDKSGEQQPAPAGHISARVPHSVSRGEFATGVIVMTGQTEFVLDFVQGLVQPPALVARVFMPHVVLSQLAAALKDNLSKYENRFGPVPAISRPKTSQNPTPLQQVYDELKIDDEVLRGSYANAVMINHGTSEFKLDFLANVAPRSAVSNRVFLAAAQVPQLLSSLERSWKQFQERVREQQKPNEDQREDEPES